MHYLEVIDVDRNRIRQFPSLTCLRGLKLVIYDHNPCINAPMVADGVRRVGRWADSSDDEEDEGDGKVAEAGVKAQGSLEENEWRRSARNHRSSSYKEHDETYEFLNCRRRLMKYWGHCSTNVVSFIFILNIVFCRFLK